MRIATVADFKVGTKLITSEGYEFIISNKYMEEVWETRGCGKIVFESEARFYTVED